MCNFFNFGCNSNGDCGSIFEILCKLFGLGC